MVVKFYKTTTPIEHANKTLSNEKSITCQTVQPCDILRPTLKLTHDASNVQYNYCYIADFGRYYSMKLKSIENNFDYFECNVDVMKTWYNDICASQGTFERCMNGDEYLPDALATQYDDTQVITKHLANAFTSGNTYVLIKGAINYIND